ncbi:hypothetical protein AB834_02640 [PVC group bacterium (ex Bugula neritina AB1)]|nr:hypothetical protein AB834_02640 [PVC group bacterium (ex Bugula neritina AB1)]
MEITNKIRPLYIKYKCTKCEAFFEKPELIQEHCKTSHLNLTYKNDIKFSIRYSCSLCMLLFPSHELCKPHIASFHKRELTSQCQKCGRVCLKKDLKKHMESHAPTQTSIPSLRNKSLLKQNRFLPYLTDKQNHRKNA